MIIVAGVDLFEANKVIKGPITKIQNKISLKDYK